MLLDVLGVTVRGAQTPVARTVRSVMAATMPGSSHVVGTRERAALPAAIYANGVAAHALELDDGYTRGSVHPSAVVFPAALAVAEDVGATVGQLVDALAVGAEVTCRIAEAGHPETYWRGFHNTPLAGVFGAAAATGFLSGLDSRAMASALGLACSHSSGLFEFVEDGADVKRLHPGMAARDGWQCAVLAAAGISGPGRALEGRRGYFQAFTGAVGEAPKKVLDGLGMTWRIHEAYIKPHACCRALHASVDALLHLRQVEGLQWADVEELTVTTYRKAAEYSGTRIESLLDAQMSLPVAAVLALRFGRVGMDELAWAASATGLREDLDRIVVQHSTEMDALYPPLRPTSVHVKTKAGMLEHYVERPYGEPGNSMSPADLQEKFLALASPVIGDGAAADLLDAVNDADRPVRELVDLARPGHPVESRAC
jgi:2-methylcitrate dehydratase PrpD